MAGEPGASFFAPSRPATAGAPAGAETICHDGELTARHAESLEVRTSTFHSAGALSVCHNSIRLSDADSLGASPSCRYGFSRNGDASPDVWLSNRATDSRQTAAAVSLVIVLRVIGRSLDY